MKYLLLTGSIIAAASGWALPAGADLFNIGSTFQVELTNSPDTGTFTANLTPGTQTIDGGKLNLEIGTIQEINGSGHTVLEWLTFQLTTANGTPFNNGQVNWGMSENGLQAVVPVNFVGGFNGAFVNNGTATTAFTASPFGNFSPGSVSMDGTVSFGSGLYSNASFGSTPFAAGALPNLFSFIDPFNHLDACCGITAATVTGWEQAWEFTPQHTAPVPEPASIALFGAGLLGLGWTLRRTRNH